MNILDIEAPLIAAVNGPARCARVCLDQPGLRRRNCSTIPAACNRST
jgi:hypothetical protein